MQPQTNGVSGAALRSARWRSEAGPLCASWPGPWALLPSPEGLRVPEALSLGSWPPRPGTCSGCCSRVRCLWPRARHPRGSQPCCRRSRRRTDMRSQARAHEAGPATEAVASLQAASGLAHETQPLPGRSLPCRLHPCAPPLERGVRSPASALPAGAATSSEKTQGNQRGGLPRHVTHMATTSSRGPC